MERDSERMDYDAFPASFEVSELERDVLWSLVATAMRARPEANGITLRKFFEPFGYFLTTIGTDPKRLEDLSQELQDGNFRFPFGQLDVRQGTVERVSLKDHLGAGT